MVTYRGVKGDARILCGNIQGEFQDILGRGFEGQGLRFALADSG